MSLHRPNRTGELIVSAVLLLVLSTGIGCGPSPGADAASTVGHSPATADASELSADSPATTSDIVAAVDDLGVSNARRPLPGLLTAGQITPQQFTALEELGYRHFINLRTEGESGTGWEEDRESSSTYIRIPISGSSGLTRENAERLADALAAAGEEPAVLYCASSNRVGALLALKARWLDGADPEAALELGRSAGMTRLEPAVREILGLADGDR